MRQAWLAVFAVVVGYLPSRCQWKRQESLLFLHYGYDPSINGHRQACTGKFTSECSLLKLGTPLILSKDS